MGSRRRFLTAAAATLIASIGRQKNAVAAGDPEGAPAGKKAKPEPLPYRNPHLSIEQRVDDLLGRMTLEEKVAQTLSIWPEMQHGFTDAKGNFAPPAAAALLHHGMGQISRASAGKDPSSNAEFSNAIQKYLVEHTRLGIPAIIHEEALHGMMAQGATSFPQAIALSSTWDTDLVEKVFAAATAEVRARGGHQVLAPVLGPARDPRWGRTEETYGEDPYHNARIGEACIRGFQGAGPEVDNRHVIATAKHFAVHSQPEGGENCAPGNYSERVVRENFLPPFEAAIKKAGALSVMASYNEVDGIPSHSSHWLLERILRQEWGFQGYVVSDYFGVRQLITLHHVADTPEEAAKKALEAGVDVELPSGDCYKTLGDQIRIGRIAEATLDQAVARTLRAKFMLGLFENPYVDPAYAAQISNNPDHRKLALQAAQEAIILLKNENNLLPLGRSKIKSIAVIGPNAGICILGEYSGQPPQAVSILEGIRNKVGSTIRVQYAEGCKITKNPTGWNDDKVELPSVASDEREIAEAVRAAKECDVALVVIGGNEQTSREAWSKTHLGDRASLDLIGRQNDLLKAVLATGKPTVVFLINGRPLAIDYVAEHVPAILEGWYLGEETGNAVADVIFGDTNPSGKLPISIPRSVGQLPAFYNYKPSAHRGYLFAKRGPLFPFGHGLSYTSFEYSNLKLSPSASIEPQGEITVCVEVKNSGAVAGAEVVQLYIRDEVSSVTRPVKELKGFERIFLKPGETKTVTFKLTPAELSFLNEEMKRVVEPGMFEIMVGSSSVSYKTVKLRVLKP